MLHAARRLAPCALGAAIVAPSVGWIALDRSVWPWDQAWFAQHAVVLYETARSDPAAWPRALVQSTPWKPPAVAWIGHAFVPVGLALGSVDAGLLLSVWVTHVAALAVLFLALLELSPRTSVAVAGTLAAGAAPIFVGLTTQFLAEASQTLATAWFVLVLSRARRWSAPRTLAHLLAAGSFAMLAKTTSPLYCVVPGLLAAAVAARRLRDPARRASWREARLPWALALLLGAAAALWYGANLPAALHHASVASFGPVAELYGRREGYVAGLLAWWHAMARVFVLAPLAPPLLALAVVAVVRRLRAGPLSGGRHLDLCAAAAALQLTLTTCAFALSPVRESRYLAPLLPFFAVLTTWALAHAGARCVAPVVATALLVQLALVHTQLLGVWQARPSALRAAIGLEAQLVDVHRDPGPARVLQAIVERTCGRGGFGAASFVGIDLLHLNGHSLTYAAAKERLAGRAGHCTYESVAFASLEAARRLVGERGYTWWIAVDPAVHPVPPYHAFLNQTAPVLFRRLRRRAVLQPEPWSGPPGILLYRFVRR